MALIETDFLLALASKDDVHHNEIIKLIKLIKPLKLSPYSLMELDLIILSGRIKVRIPEFYESLDKVLTYYGIEIIKPSPKHIAKGWEIREKYELTYFDSLHASTAIIENEMLVSYDKIYSNIEELRYCNPRDLLKMYKVNE